MGGSRLFQLKPFQHVSLAINTFRVMSAFIATGTARGAAVALGLPAAVLAYNLTLPKEGPALLDTQSAQRVGMMERLCTAPALGQASEQTVNKILRNNSVAHSHGSKILTLECFRAVPFRRCLGGAYCSM